MALAETNENLPTARATEAAGNHDAAKVSLTKREIRLDVIFKCLFRNWKHYIVPCIVTAILSVLYVLQLPRYYKASVMLAPESSGTSSMGGLSSLAAMAGVRIGNSSTEDAIIPMFYPDIMKSTDFLVPLLNVQVQTEKGDFKGTMGTYMTQHVKASFIDTWKAKLTDAITKPEHKLSVDKAGTFHIDPFKMTKTENDVCDFLSSMISCSVDKKTDVISIDVTTQDPLVAALLADTLLSRLQGFITDYRTKKAKNDCAYYKKLCESAKANYEAKQHEYAVYADAYTDVVLESYKVKEERLENEMQLAYTNYSQLKQQVQLAEAKVLERTPAFTVIQNASVPVKPAGPKRMIIVGICMMLCIVVTSVVIVARDKSIKL